jgi:hypothetical protein
MTHDIPARGHDPPPEPEEVELPEIIDKARRVLQAMETVSTSPKTRAIISPARRRSRSLGVPARRREVFRTDVPESTNTGAFQCLP